jgi:hypothetical protein
MVVVREVGWGAGGAGGGTGGGAVTTPKFWEAWLIDPNEKEKEVKWDTISVSAHPYIRVLF